MVKQNSDLVQNSDSVLYQITIDGELQDHLVSRVAGLSAQFHKSDSRKYTILTGNVRDKSELSGVLNTLCNYNHTIISVIKIN